jgi:hypothetical protein
MKNFNNIRKILNFTTRNILGIIRNKIVYLLNNKNFIFTSFILIILPLIIITFVS